MYRVYSTVEVKPGKHQIKFPIPSLYKPYKFVEICRVLIFLFPKGQTIQIALSNKLMRQGFCLLHQHMSMLTKATNSLNRQNYWVIDRVEPKSMDSVAVNETVLSSSD